MFDHSSIWSLSDHAWLPFDLEELISTDRRTCESRGSARTRDGRWVFGVKLRQAAYGFPMGEQWQRHDSKMVRRQQEAAMMGFHVRFWQLLAIGPVMGFRWKVMGFWRGAAASSKWFFPMGERWQRRDGEITVMEEKAAIVGSVVRFRQRKWGKMFDGYWGVEDDSNVVGEEIVEFFFCLLISQLKMADDNLSLLQLSPSALSFLSRAAIGRFKTADEETRNGRTNG
ncbi:hypothetical protein ACLOJK_018260 [Asimina triloba]